MTTAAHTPPVAVVVVTWNGLDDVTVCLESFACVGYPNYKVVVVDNGSEEYAFPRTLLDGRLAYHQVDPPWA